MKRTLMGMSILAAALSFGTPSFAESLNNDIVIDQNGKSVIDARGNCVYTKWDGNSHKCGAPAPKAEEPMISREDRTVYFDFNKSTLNPEAKRKLNSLVSVVARSGKVTSAKIAGYADEIGSNSYNLKLSKKRASSVAKYLQHKGLDSRVVDMKAMGEDYSVTQCDKKLPRKELIACLAQDRRVVIELDYNKK